MDGRRLIALAGVISTVVVAAAVGLNASDTDGWRTAARGTARLSLMWFCVVASASSINRLWPGKVGKWMMRNRRMLGLAFAVAHGIHAFAFLRYFSVVEGGVSASVSSATLYGGGAGYVLIAAMAATSTNGAVKRLGRRRWNSLHKVGIYAVLGIFAFTYIPRGLVGDPLGIAASVVIVAVIALRTAARLRQRRRNVKK